MRSARPAPRPLSLDGLPRVPFAAPEWTRRLARVRATFAHDVSVAIRGLGAVTLAARGVRWMPAGVPARMPGDGEWFAATVAGHAGGLVVDRGLAHRMVARLVGAGEPVARAPLPLSPAERGVLAAVVLAVTEAAGAAGEIALSLGPPVAPAGGERMCLDLDVRVPGTAGWAAIETSVAALPARTGRATRVAPDLPLVAALEAGRTAVPGAVLAAAAPGDVLVFGGISALADHLDWPIRFRVAQTWLPARLGRTGDVSRDGERRQFEESAAMSVGRERESGAAPAVAGDAAEVLSALPVEVVAEIGRFTLRGDELAGLMAGGVLPLGLPRSGQVQVRVGDRVWALGELVAVGDEMGVRLTEIRR